MKIFPALIFLPFFAGACKPDSVKTGNKPHAETPKEQTADYKVKFEKKIFTSHDCSIPTLTVKKSGDLLFLHDSHVDSENLSCIDYNTGKELWKIPHTVEEVFLYRGKLLVQFEDRVELLDMLTGKSSWKMDSTYIHYYEVRGLEPGDLLPVTHRGQTGLLDLVQRKITVMSDSIVVAAHFKTDEQGHVRRTFTGLDKTQKVPGKLQRAVVLENETGARQTYFWSLEEGKRLFTVSIYKEKQPVDTLSWTIPDNNYPETDSPRDHRGEPDPQTLMADVYFIDGRLIFFENYVMYRWSWGRGANRITCIDPEQQYIKYQVWGQGPGESVFSTFHFTDDVILRSSGVLHFQQDKCRHSPLNLRTGETLDSLPGNANIIAGFKPNLLACFDYQSTITDTAKSKYEHRVSVTIVNHATGRYSETFDFQFGEDYPYEPFLFADDGLLILYHFNRKTNKTELFCYRVTPGG
ncbi:MAG: hypothetical protein FD123_580 [Bacteroidetes bacterium]|nr:MAG: hypothetical protein FD123_580 [Bacteroidota bacterium]